MSFSEMPYRKSKTKPKRAKNMWFQIRRQKKFSRFFLAIGTLQCHNRCAHLWGRVWQTEVPAKMCTELCWVVSNRVVYRTGHWSQRSPFSGYTTLECVCEDRWNCDLVFSVGWMCSGVLWNHWGSSKLLPFLIEALNHQSWELKLFHTIYGICASGRNWSVFITLVCCRNADWEQMFVWKKSNSRVFFYCRTWNPQQPPKSNSWKILIGPSPWKKTCNWCNIMYLESYFWWFM